MVESLHPITPPVEDYLKAVYTAGREDRAKGGGRVTTSMIAERMSVSPASATNMMQRLAEMNLVEYVPYQGVSLTAAGEKIALEVIRHHRLIELYLAEALGYSWDTVHDEAERLEHVISEEFEDRIDAMLGHPTIDPHGHPIPPKSGVLPLDASQALSEAPVGTSAVVERVSDRDGHVLRQLSAIDLVPGARVTVLERSAEGLILASPEGDTVPVPHDLARRVFVRLT